MAITKTGGLVRGLWRGAKGGAGYVGKSLKSIGDGLSPVGRAAGAVAGGAYKVTKGIGTTGLQAAGAVGEGMAKHPKAGIVLGTGALFGGYALPKRMHEGMSYADPNQFYTSQSSIRGRISPISKDPNLQKLIASQNRFF